MKRIILFSLLMSVACCVFAAKERKTVFIIIDGIAADNMERLQPKNMFDIARKGHYSRAYCGGKVGQYSETPTISAIGYANILTGTWMNKHNVRGNTNIQENYNYWTIFRIAEEQKRDVRTAIFSSWTDNRTVLLGEGKPENGSIKLDYAYDGYDTAPDLKYLKHDLHIYEFDSIVCREAARCLREDAPDLSWVYLWYPDDAYHLFGNSAYSDYYVTKEDEHIGKVWEAVQYREKNFNEEWLVIVLADHGRDEQGYHHGGQSERARTVWISTNQKKVNRQFAEPWLSHVDVLPTICRYMNFEVPRDVAFEQDGISFIGKRDIYDLTAYNYEENVILNWKVDEAKGMADVYLAPENKFKEEGRENWIKVATVPARDGQCKVDLTAYKSSLYKFVVATANTHLTVWNPVNPNRSVRP